MGRNLVDAANKMGQSWSMTGIPWYYRRQWTGVLRHPVLRTRPVLWDATLAAKSAHHDVVHLHTGGLSPHMRWLRAPWVLHFHGTDVRSRQYDGWASKLEYGVQHADAVLYSTPDLTSHVHNLTDRGQYFPVTIRTDALPAWHPRRDRVVFASRWDDVKGATQQLEVARRVRELHPRVELIGLDWGERASEAAAAGIRLVPKMPPDQFQAWLATASVVIGQMTKILSVSELEALSIGVPLVTTADRDFYPLLRESSASSVDAVAHAVVQALDDPENAARQQDGPGFVSGEHDAKAGVERLISLYSSIISAAKNRNGDDGR
ncbi:glycosyltransferase family 4 protein [Arthrobacter echini]|uniref:Glycosyltransferase family 4 protein n=1 Tax=Arthrobacter echini TaxID=1529066 RepID=A0A4S5E3F2_9MICC|nr:glycosyltransferase family 4 protein [Arthrobacter echini]THJ65954.1 glycosyltransferase family 4 protein [Arthrobacter echini]